MNDCYKRWIGNYTILLLMVAGGIWLPLRFGAGPGLAQFLVLFISLTVFGWYGFGDRGVKAERTVCQEMTTSRQRILEIQEVMLDLSNSMIHVESFTELMDIILKKAMLVIPQAQCGSILVMNDEGRLQFRAIAGFEKALFDVELEPEESYQWVATGGVFKGPIIIEDLQKYSKTNMGEESFEAMDDIDALSVQSSLSAPLLIDGNYFGSLNIDSTEQGMFGEEDVKLIEYFANQVTIAIANRKLYDRLVFMSNNDSLTGVYNRNYFETKLMERMRSEGKAIEPFCVVIADLNKFKQVNDTHGHNAGDLVLKDFTDHFSEHVSDTDLFARHGGDEFAAVFFNCTEAQAQDKLKTIYDNVTEEALFLPGSNEHLAYNFSYGIAEYPRETHQLKELVHLADSRMYAHKRQQTGDLS